MISMKEILEGALHFSWATEKGHGEVVKILRWREEVNPNKLDISGKIPLSFAASGERKGAVETLLGREEVNPNKSDSHS